MTIKRFGYGTDYRSGGIGMPGIIEKQDGEYVLHADYAALLSHNEMQAAQLRKQASEMAAIGAGGVSALPIISVLHNVKHEVIPADQITAQALAMLNERLSPAEHAAFAVWVRDACSYPDYFKIALDSEWARGALDGWNGRAMHGAATHIAEPATHIAQELTNCPGIPRNHYIPDADAPQPPTSAQPDPAMAGDEISDSEVVDLAVDHFEIDADRMPYNVVRFARALLKRVQPASGED